MVISDSIILFVSALAAFLDFKIRRIPNWLILGGAVSGMLLNSALGTSHLVQSVLGFGVGIAVLIVPFALGWIGAGDVKFFGVVGALLGVHWLPRVFFYSALVAGLIAMGSLAFGFARVSGLRSFWLDFKTAILSMGNVLPDPVANRNPNGAGSVPWGVAFAGGTVIAYYIDPSGQWAGF